MGSGGLGGNGKGQGPMGGGRRRSAGLFGKEQLEEAEGALGLLPGPAPDAVRRSPGGRGAGGEGGGEKVCGARCACAYEFA